MKLDELKAALAEEAMREPVVVEASVAKVIRRARRQRRRHRIVFAGACVAAVGLSVSLISWIDRDDASDQILTMSPSGDLVVAVLSTRAVDAEAGLYESEVVYVDPTTGRTRSEPVPANNYGDYPVPLLQIGDRLLLPGGQEGLQRAPIDLSSPPQDLAPALVFVPSAQPDRVWTVSDWQIGNVGPFTVTEIDAAGMPATGPVLLPDEAGWPIVGTDAGLVVYGRESGALLVDPATGEITRRIPDVQHFQGNGWGASNLFAWVGPCSSPPRCDLLHLLDLATGVERIVEPPEGATGYVFDGALSPDGQTLALFTTTETAGQQLVLVDTSTGDAQPVLGSTNGGSHVSWAPDGTSVFFGQDDSTTVSVYHLGDPSSRRIREDLDAFTAILAIEPADTDGEVTEGTSTAEPSAVDGPIVSEPGGVESLPGPPIDVRGDAAVVWTGAELVVWGGDVEAANMGLPGGNRDYADGAAFNPATRAWRRLSPSPLPSSGDTAVGVMTDGGVVISRGRSTALWDPDDDTWRDLEDAPRPVHDLASNGAVVMSYSSNAVLDIDSGLWRELPAPPLQLERPTITWTGRELIVIGGPDSPFTSAAAIAFDLESDRWRTLPSPPSALRAEALSADWDGERVVVVNYDMTAATYDPSSESWTELPPVPARFYEWYPYLRSTGGRSVAFMASALVVLNEDDRWIPLPYGGIPGGFVETTRSGPDVDARDGTLFIWALDSETSTNTLTAVDLDRLVESANRIQVGVGSVALGEGAALVDASYRTGDGETVRAVVEEADGGRCTVTSAYGNGTVGHPVEETLQNDAQPRTWSRDVAGRTWQTAATTSDIFTVACDDAETARALATSSSFAGR